MRSVPNVFADRSPQGSPTPLRTVFFGTAELACPSLAALARTPEFQVAAVVTQPDRPKGRDLKRQPAPVKTLALELGLPVWQPERCRAPAFLDQLRAAAPAFIVVAAYGQLLPPDLLAIPPLGCLNVHTSLLPRYRGAAPIQWAILNGDTETGVTIMKIDEGLDTGDLLTRAATPILPTDDARSLHDRLAAFGAGLLVRTLQEYVAGRITPHPQPAKDACYARKIVKADGLLDWTRPARELHRRLRAFTPWPGVFTHQPGQKPILLKIHRAEVVRASAGRPGEILQANQQGLVVRCGEDGWRILELQREGGRRLAASEFLAGHPLAPGVVLG